MNRVHSNPALTNALAKENAETAYANAKEVGLEPTVRFVHAKTPVQDMEYATSLPLLANVLQAT